MKKTKPGSTGKKPDMEAVMGTLLRVGVIVAASVVVVGGMLFFIQHPGIGINYKAFKGEPARLRHLSLIIGEAFDLRSRSVIQFGLLLLIATPIARVVLSLFGFMLKKDRTYVFITLLVLMVLLFSLFTGD